MPPVVTAAAAWAAKYLTVKAIGAWLLKAVITAAVSYGLGRLVTRGAKSSGGLTSTASPLDLRIDSMAPHRVIYGETTVGPVLRFRHAAGANNKYLYLILVWAATPCDEIVALKADGVVVPLDENGMATGTFAGVIRCTHHLGAHDQTADANFISEIGSVWTADHRLKGRTYSAVRVEWNQDKFPVGLPQFTAVIRGRKVWDFTDEGQDPDDPSTWEWSDNPAFCTADFIRGVPMLNGAGALIRPYGVGAADSRLPEARWVACANACAEVVAKTALSKQCDIEEGNRHIGCSDVYGITVGLSVSGTGIPEGTTVVSVDGSGTFFTVDQDPTATNNDETLLVGETEKRYTCNGCFDVDASPPAVLDALAGSMAGKIVPVGSEFYPFAGVWVEPDFTVDETMLRALPGASNPLPRRERINVVKGTFNNPAANHQRDDFPQVVSDAFIEEDGAELARDLDLAFTNSASMAQRIAKIALLRSRQGLVTNWPCNLRAIPAMTGENVGVDSTEFGWTGKAFEVVEFTLQIQQGDDGGLGFVPDLVMQETDSSIFDWSTSEEETKDPAPNTNLPNPREVAAPTNLVVTSGATTVHIQEDGTAVPRAKLSWTAPADQAVLSGGQILIEYKRSAAEEWSQAAPVPGNQTSTYVTDVLIGVNYDFRIRSENNFMVRSEYATPAAGAHTVAGDTTAPDAVTGLSATAGAGFVALAWTRSSAPDISEYGIYRHTSNSFGSASKIAEISGTKFIDANVATGTQYYYWIVAIDGSENAGSPSSSANATPTAPISTVAPSTPSAPTFNTEGSYLSVDGTVFSFITINTPALPTGAIVVDVLYRIDGSSSWIIADQKTGVGTARIDDLSPGVTYEFAIRGVSNGGALSTVSSVLSRAAPNYSTAPSNPTGFTFIAGNGASELTPPAKLYRYASNGHVVLMRAMTATFTPSSSKNVRFVEFIMASASPALIYDVNGPDFRAGPEARHVFLYKVGEDASGTPSDYSAMKLWVKCIDYSGNASSFTDLGNINAYLQKPTGNMIRQNADAVDITGGAIEDAALVTESLKVGDTGASSVREVVAEFVATHVELLTGGSPFETINFDISNRGFTAAPDVGAVDIATGDATMIDAYYQFDAGGSSSTNAVVIVRALDGGNLPNANIRLSLRFTEYD